MTHSLNFLEQQEFHPQPLPRKSEPVQRPKRPAPRRRKRLIVVLVLLVLLAIVGWVVAILIAVGQVAAAALDGKDALYRARDAAVALRFEEAQEELQAADAYFAKAEERFWILRSTEFIPWVGAQVQASDAIIVSSRNIIQALEEVIDLGAELIRLSGLTEEDIAAMTQGLEPSITFEDLSAETKQSILLRLAASASDLELIQAKIAIAQDELSKIPRDEVVGPVLLALDPVVAKLTEAQEILHTLSIAASILPEVAGLGGERSHLLLFINNTELRPGGGFIGTYGVMKMENGDITHLDTKDVYTLDDAAAPYVQRTPPRALTTYNGSTEWFFRDANWSPDFALSSRQTLDLFSGEVSSLPPELRSVQEPVTFSSVIGITPTFASDLMKITGPITVGGQTFTSENIIDKLEYEVEFGYVGKDIPPTQRKEIVADLVNEMKARLYGLPLSQWAAVLELVEHAFTTKELVFYSEHQPTQDILTTVGWAGRVQPTGTDVQMVVDANLASLKSDPAVDRSIRYEIFKNTDGSYIGRTSITYNHTGTFDWKTTRYRTYTRLYVPAGTGLIRASGTLVNDARLNPSGAAGTVDVGSELGLTTFGAFTSVEPGESRTLVFEYKLAPQVVGAIEQGFYDLSWVKQIGAEQYELTLDLDFDKTVTRATPGEESVYWGDDTYSLNTDLDQDIEFKVDL